MDEEQAHTFYQERNDAFNDGTIPVVRAFLDRYKIPAPSDDKELALNILAVRMYYGISTGGDYYKDQFTLLINGHPVID